jgi:hypothetical protein
VARDPHVVVEAAGHERHLLHGREAEHERLEALRRRRRQQAHVDERVQRAADVGQRHARGEPGDHAGAPQPPHAVGGAVRAQPHLLAELGERRPSVSDERVDDLEVDRVESCRFHRPTVQAQSIRER